MKKFFVLLAVFAITVGSAFAAEGTGSWGDVSVPGEGAKATMEVTFDLTSYEGMFNIGFSDNPPTVVEGALSEFTPKKSLSLTLTGDEYTGSTNIFYAIKLLNESETKYDVTMSIAEKLRPTTGANTDNDIAAIDWTVSAGAVALQTKETAVKSGVVFDDITSDGAWTVGSLPLSVSTDGFENASLDNATYAGTVTLKIATAN